MIADDHDETIKIMHHDKLWLSNEEILDYLVNLKKTKLGVECNYCSCNLVQIISTEEKVPSVLSCNNKYYFYFFIISLTGNPDFF